MRRDRPGQIAVLVAVVLLVMVSFCVFDAGDGTGLDLCSVMLLPVAVLVLGGPPPLLGRLVPVQIPARPANAPEHPIPPPRT